MSEVFDFGTPRRGGEELRTPLRPRTTDPISAERSPGVHAVPVIHSWHDSSPLSPTPTNLPIRLCQTTQRTTAFPSSPMLVDGLKRRLSMPSVSSKQLIKMTTDFDEDPYIVGLAGNMSVYANMVKAIAGAAVFAMPFVVMQMGVIGACVTLTVLALLAGYSMTLLIKAKHLVAEQTLEQYISYVNVAQQAFGPVGAGIAYFLSVIASIGVAAANLTFVVQTVLKILQSYNVDSIQPWHMSLVALLLVSPLTWLRSFKILGYASVLGNICLLAGIGGTLGFGISQEHTLHGNVTLFNLEGIPSSLGTASFVFCVNFMFLPIERSMKQPQDFNRVMWGCLSSVTLCIQAFGVICYSLFLEDSCGNILLNLSHTGVGGSVLKGALCVSLLASFPLSIAPACETIEQSLMPLIPYGGHHRGIKRRCMRQVLIFGALGLSQIKQFTTITNLIGAFSSLPLTLILPPAMYIKLATRSQLFPILRASQQENADNNNLDTISEVFFMDDEKTETDGLLKKSSNENRRSLPNYSIGVRDVSLSNLSKDDVDQQQHLHKQHAEFDSSNGYLIMPMMLLVVGIIITAVTIIFIIKEMAAPQPPLPLQCR